MQPTEYDDGQTLILAASERLARDLRQRAAITHRARGETLWADPPVRSLPRWLEALWYEQWPERRVATPVEEALAFEDAISADPDGAPLLAPHQTAEIARRAHRLCADYRIDEHDARLSATPEGAAFARWRQQARQAVAERGLISAAELVEALESLETLSGLPGRIVTTGFTTPTPALDHWIEHLEGRGVTVIDAGDEAFGRNAVACRRTATETDAREAAARQIRDWLVPHADQPGEAPSIALVVPDFERERAQLAETLQRVLAPHTAYPGHGADPVPYRFVVGRPLPEQEIINHALRALSLARSDNDYEQITSQLLSMRFAGNGAEAAGRARVDRELREQGHRRVPLSAIRRLADAHAPRLARRLRALDHALKHYNQPAPPSVWARRFRRRLQLLGWPGGGRHDSVTYQAIDQFRTQLEGFARYDVNRPRLSHAEAVGLLRRDLSAHLFLSRPEHRIPVEIVPLESIDGHHYDHAVVLDLHAEALPGKPHPNPLIPMDLQREHAMPGADADTQFTRARELIEAIERLSPDTHIFAADFTDLGQPRTPSPLFTHWGETEAATPAEVEDKPALETISSSAPEATRAERERTRGGASVLSLQAQHPFYAFVRHRLGAEALPEPESGITPRLRGIALHDSMAHIWRELRDSHRLQGLEEHEQRELVGDALQWAFNGNDLSALQHEHPNLARRERDRAEQVIHEWLEHERTRFHPFRVIHTERRMEEPVGPLHPRTRLDRTDHVDTGQGKWALIIDYKSGAEVDVRGWHPENFLEPQLPHYATTIDAGEHPVGGIAFAHLAPGAARLHSWTGFAAELAEDARGVHRDDWPELIERWRTRLHELAVAYAEGVACYDPDAARSLRHLHGDLEILARTDPAIRAA